MSGIPLELILTVGVSLGTFLIPLESGMRWEGGRQQLLSLCAATLCREPMRSIQGRRRSDTPLPMPVFPNPCGSQEESAMSRIPPSWLGVRVRKSQGDNDAERQQVRAWRTA